MQFRWQLHAVKGSRALLAASSLRALWLKFGPLTPVLIWVSGDRVLGEVEKNNFIALPGTRGHHRLMPSKLLSWPGGSSEEFCSKWLKEEGVISLWTFCWLIDGEISGSQHSQSSGSNWSGVYLLLSSIQLHSSFWWRFQYLQNSSKMFLHTSLEGEPRPKAALLFLNYSSCVSIFPPLPNWQLFAPDLWNSGKVKEAITSKQEMGDPERLLCPGTPQDPARFQH